MIIASTTTPKENMTKIAVEMNSTSIVLIVITIFLFISCVSLLLLIIKKWRTEYSVITRVVDGAEEAMEMI